MPMRSKPATRCAPARRSNASSPPPTCLTRCRAARSAVRPKPLPASRPATACAPGTSIRRPTRGCRATRAKKSASSRRSAAATSFPTPPRSAKATIRNGSTPCCSTAANCGARLPTRRSRSRSRRSSRIWSRRDYYPPPERGGASEASRWGSAAATLAQAVRPRTPTLPSPFQGEGFGQRRWRSNSQVSRRGLMTTNTAALRATQSVAGVPRNDDGPVFREPWEAEAFALALSLNERGLFTWKEWAATLGDEIKKAQAAGDPDTGETYYHHWLATLERIVAEKGVTNARQLARTRHAWEHACERTPHGTPIELRPGDFHD